MAVWAEQDLRIEMTAEQGFRLPLSARPTIEQCVSAISSLVRMPGL